MAADIVVIFVTQRVSEVYIPGSMSACGTRTKKAEACCHTSVSSDRLLNCCLLWLVIGQSVHKAFHAHWFLRGFGSEHPCIDTQQLTCKLSVTSSPVSCYKQRLFLFNNLPSYELNGSNLIWSDTTRFIVANPGMN